MGAGGSKTGETPVLVPDLGAVGTRSWSGCYRGATGSGPLASARMHQVSFEWRPHRPETHGDVSVRVDGRPLADLVRGAELPAASAEGSPSLAGSYGGIPLWWFQGDGARSVTDHYLGGAESHLHSGPHTKTVLLACECGEPGCWPLMARVTVSESEVVWDEFEQPHRNAWNYDDLGPLRFEREQYGDALRELESSAS